MLLFYFIFPQSFAMMYETYQIPPYLLPKSQQFIIPSLALPFKTCDDSYFLLSLYFSLNLPITGLLYYLKQD